MIVIVEGKNDYNKLKSIFPVLDILITNGSSVSSEFIELVKKLAVKEEIVLLLDPDHPGEKIRRTIQEVVPDAMHIFADKKKAISKNKRKVGIEHMNKEDIISLFDEIKTAKRASDITQEMLYEYGLIGQECSKDKRIQLGLRLGIGYTNSKQLLKRLHLFGISKKELEQNL